MASEEQKPTADAAELSQWAEQTEGLLGKDLYLVNDRGKLVLKEGDEYARTCIMKFHTSATYRKRKWPTIKVSIDGPTTSLDGADALFWSEAAAEKFVWPYYHSQRLYKEEVSTLHNAFKETTEYVALLHTWPSHMEGMRGQLKPLGLNHTETGLTVLEWK